MHAPAQAERSRAGISLARAGDLFSQRAAPLIDSFHESPPRRALGKLARL